jgi:hypothetical protein
MKSESRVMRKLLLITFGTVLMVPLGAGAALADNGPHIKYGPASSVTPDGCAGCHRLHSAKTDMLTVAVQPQLLTRTAIGRRTHPGRFAVVVSRAQGSTQPGPVRTL